MEANQLNLEVRDSVFNPNLSRDDPANLVNFREAGDDTYYYKVWLYLDGYDLPYVESVIYELDPTFPEPTQTVRRTASNPNCQLSFWTWGLFTVTATISDKKGFKYRVSHELVYDRELPTDPDKYLKNTEEPKAASRPTLVSA